MNYILCQMPTPFFQIANTSHFADIFNLRTLPSHITNSQTPGCGPPKLWLANVPFSSFAGRSGRRFAGVFCWIPATRRVELFWPPKIERSSFFPRIELGRMCFSPNASVLLVPSVMFARRSRGFQFVMVTDPPACDISNIAAMKAPSSFTFLTPGSVPWQGL